MRSGRPAARTANHFAVAFQHDCGSSRACSQARLFDDLMEHNLERQLGREIRRKAGAAGGGKLGG
jgi:hypothetical protein